ncbi:MAG: hypothetical protein C0621_07385 [Desulfuromonas sp.]|nr:MAG: hypothetical protein C0621_07385 [Desulfuromonas sp.]
MSDSQENLKATSEKIWGATRKKLHVAGFQASRYKRIVQKKIDLSAVHKKITTVHTDLGKLIDDSREAKVEDILGQEQVERLFSKIDSLKHAAAAIEEEIAAIKAETFGEDEEKETEGNRDTEPTP